MRGFSTLELLIALALASITISAVVLVAFGNQSTTLGIAISAQANREAQALLVAQDALATTDFNLINATTSIAGMYHQTISVQFSPDFTQKTVTANVSWGNPLPLSTSLSESFSNLENVQAPDTCDSSINDLEKWKNSIERDYDFGALVDGGTPLAGFSLSAVDAYEGKLYVTADSAPSGNRNTFFIFDISGATHAPVLLSAIDNDPSNATGLKGIAVASTSAGIYVYAASASSFVKGQLQIINVTDPVHPAIVSTYKIATSTVPAAGLGNTIFYKDGYVYLGLKSASGGSEFNIIDVRDPAHPVWTGGYSFGGHDVDSIVVKKSYAYIAHPSATSQDQLTILDVSDPANPHRVGGFSYATGGFANGKSAAVVGDKIYFGRTASNISNAPDSIPEFYLLDGSNPASLPLLASTTLAAGNSVNAIRVRGDLVFLLTNTQLQIWNSANPAHPLPWTSDSATSTFMRLPGGQGVALDCEGDTLYMTSHAKTGTADILSVISSGL